MNEIERARKLLKPCPSIEKVEMILANNWNLERGRESTTIQIDSYDDANYYVKSNDGKSYLVKFYNGADSESKEIINGYASMLGHINDFFEDAESLGGEMPSSRVTVPKIIMSNANSNIVYISDCEVVSGSKAVVGVCVFDWIHGQTLNRFGMTPISAIGVGRAVGLMAQSLVEYDCPAFHRYHAWDLVNFKDCEQFVRYVEEEDVRQIITECISDFESTVIPDSVFFRKSVIMGDCNDANVIVDSVNGSIINGIIDFGDSVYTWCVNDIAIALAYGLLTEFGKENIFQLLALMFGGYCCIRDLNETELRHLKSLIEVRLCISVSIGAYSIFQNPANREYLSIHSQPAKSILRRLYAEDNEYITALLRNIVAGVASLRNEKLSNAELVEAFLRIESESTLNAK